MVNVRCCLQDAAIYKVVGASYEVESFLGPCPMCVGMIICRTILTRYTIRPSSRRLVSGSIPVTTAI